MKFCNGLLKLLSLAKPIRPTLATIGNGSQLTLTIIADDDG
jgi:hypothetical protein